MQTRSLRTLTTIARHGSFAAAAKTLHMTLSAVSMQMKALEAELEAELFDRTFRPPHLTPLGRAVCAQAEEMLRQETALQALCRTGDALTGRFRIGFVATASIRLLPQFLARARALAPHAELEIETGVSEHLEARVRAGLLDAAVVTAAPGGTSGLRYCGLRREAMVLARPAGAAPDMHGLFATLPFFHFQANSGIGKLIADHVAPYMQDGTQVIYLDSVEAIMGCVNSAIGFTLLPEPDVVRAIGPQTVRGPDLSPSLYRDLSLVSALTTPADQADRLVDLFLPDISGGARNF